jgi:hypothetical protein
MFRKLFSSQILRTLRSASVILALSSSLASFGAQSSSAQDLAQRLILKDGSYQLVTKYEVKGDRVRYLSAERNEWEELPSDLVDWPATQKYQKERASGASSPAAAQVEKDFENARDIDEETLPEVAPGLRLPEASGVFLLDNFKGEPQLLEISQTTGDVDRKVKGNIFHPTLDPIGSSKITIELDGEHAAVQSHAEIPSLYIRAEEPLDQVDPVTKTQSNSTSTTSNSSGSTSAKDSAQTDNSKTNSTGSSKPSAPNNQTWVPDRFRIIRTQVRNGRRTIDDIKRSVSGKPGEDLKFVKTTTIRVSGGWLKITPAENLPAGEYALVEMTSDVGMNLYLWDFGVNRAAPPNKNPYLPDKPDSSH